MAERRDAAGPRSGSRRNAIPVSSFSRTRIVIYCLKWLKCERSHDCISARAVVAFHSSFTLPWSRPRQLSIALLVTVLSDLEGIQKNNDSNKFSVFQGGECSGGYQLFGVSCYLHIQGRPWRWRHYFSQKRQYPPIRIDGVTTQKTAMWKKGHSSNCYATYNVELRQPSLFHGTISHVLLH
jgi:hypothetical protein